MTEFLLENNCKLGLMPVSGIRKILQDKMPDPASANGVPRCELYYYVDEPEKIAERLLNAGASEVSPVSGRDWGDRVGYFADPDGHIIAIAQRMH
jgi:lactoylglutathione lyase